MGTQRIRGRQLQNIRKRRLHEQPLCVLCEAKGLVREATQVDHRIPLFKGGSDDDSNRQELCEECHVLKTAADLGHKPKRKIGPDGFPI